MILKDRCGDLERFAPALVVGLLLAACGPPPTDDEDETVGKPIAQSSADDAEACDDAGDCFGDDLCRLTEVDSDGNSIGECVTLFTASDCETDADCAEDCETCECLPAAGGFGGVCLEPAGGFDECRQADDCGALYDCYAVGQSWEPGVCYRDP